MSKNSNSPVLLITNDLGPHEGGIESFILGLIAGINDRKIFILTSNQSGAKEFDAKLISAHNVEVIRDRARILLPTPRIALKAKKIIKQNQISIVWFGARSEEHTSELQSH